MRNNKINIVFMGTPEFAVPVLEKVHQELGITAVVTVPDKPQGRGRSVLPSPVSNAAEKLGIPQLKPDKLKDENFIQQLKNFAPDIILVIAFRILPPEVFSLAKIGTFNIHSSLLPKLRGAAPINWAVINGEKKTGLTTFLIDNKVDTGNLLLQESFDLPDYFTAGDLHDFMMPLAADIGFRTCKLLMSGNFTPLKQDDSLATPAPKIFPEYAMINWNLPAFTVRRFIHGYSPIPGARIIWNGKLLKILRTELTDISGIRPSVFSIRDDSFIVGCGDFALKIIELQPEGKKSMPVQIFLNGYRGPLNGTFAV